MELLKQGRAVRATKRQNSNLAEVKKSFRFYEENSFALFEKIQWVDVDFDDGLQLQDILIDVEEVYHCAAKVSFHPQSEKELYHTNINGTQNLLYACENSSVKKFCFVSSIAVLDGLNEKGSKDESSDYNVKLDHSPYAKSKHFSEMEVWRASAEGLNTVIINPGMIIGSGNWENSSGVIFENFAKPFTFSGGTSYVDVRDVAKIAVQLMDKNIFGERFILISENKKYFEMGKIIREKLGLTPPKIISKSILQMGQVLNVFFGWLIPPLRMATQSNIEAVSEMEPISNQKIKDKLNYDFVPVKESLDFHFQNYQQDQSQKK